MAACCFDPCAPVFGESAFKGAVPCKRLTTIKPTAVSELTHLNRISLIFLVGSDTRPVTESPGASIHGPLFFDCSKRHREGVGTEGLHHRWHIIRRYELHHLVFSFLIYDLNFSSGIVAFAGFGKVGGEHVYLFCKNGMA